MAAVRHLGFVLGHIWTTNSEYLGVSITLQNLVMIVRSRVTNFLAIG